MTTTLSTYITQVRRLLHDANANFWSDQELTDDINEARSRLVRDTGCLRSLQTSSVLTNQEVYSYDTLNPLTVDVININLYWGNTRIPLRYLPWTQFNAELRFWQNYIGRPIAFSMYGPRQYYVSPVPDQTYVTELDTVILPTPMSNAGDVDTIPDVFTGPVQFYASWIAKYKEQSYGEAELFKDQYVKQVQAVLANTYTRRMPDPYSTVY